ncbi:hypothetical protein KDA14_00130 [Candidatus Saccharibacteria bacterium]|nr:hypothetical protein [Candidatus Saccharibacteria bacterium]
MRSIASDLERLGMNIIEPTERIGGTPSSSARRWVPDRAPQGEMLPTSERVPEPETPAPGALAHIVLRDAVLRGFSPEPSAIAE